MSKYHSEKIRTPQGVFDSRLEYDRWIQLSLMQRAGHITQLRRQVPFELIPRQVETIQRKSPKTGRPLKPITKTVERSCSYIADFVYQDRTGTLIVEDTKGYRLPDYIIKRKLMLHKYGIKIREVRDDA